MLKTRHPPTNVNRRVQELKRSIARVTPTLEIPIGLGTLEMHDSAIHEASITVATEFGNQLSALIAKIAVEGQRY